MKQTREERTLSLKSNFYLSPNSIKLKHDDICAISIRNGRLTKRTAITHEMQFISENQLFKVDFFANKKYLFVKSTYPIKGIRSCTQHDGSHIKKIKMGYFNDQQLQLSQKGELSLLFLLNDIVNTTQLAKTNPGIITSYYLHTRRKMEKENPELREKRLTYRNISASLHTAWLSDIIRKKHYFSYNGSNLLLSFQAIIENHAEVFNSLMN